MRGPFTVRGLYWRSASYQAGALAPHLRADHVGGGLIHHPADPAGEVKMPPLEVLDRLLGPRGEQGIWSADWREEKIQPLQGGGPAAAGGPLPPGWGDSCKQVYRCYPPSRSW